MKITANGNPDFSESKYLYPDKNKAIVEIKISGSREKDYNLANIEANLEKKPENYTWHHMDDYNPTTGKCTMQLVETEAHNLSKPHYGAVRQYEKNNK
ncbi:HNH endonuclease signature motif containing protein [Capnocytophaga stomatis]|uniref:HNH endonuclease signature motif containing protein n=1 Tax=Capnocytophaga stomatis TaxID=1848904 RepID=UPI0019513774|nr:HNH endonuclease [Capnocytophaga stomatis]